ncbi:transcription elongation factor GreB [Cystobacter fuscus]|uniref:Transcription elongation factor GreB n=1 Tax=Cystobacter fuscus TaxID=43 RepID=A0A250JHB7_9BACT|nr:GreA/GreB family elongation factor [Cystobacter fuscus]ATB43023.1 transcription elongation factor GreB [Cystobacter fuscus]
MSKAFTKEDAGGEDIVLPPRPRPASGEQRYITAEGYRAMQEELAALSVPLAQEEKEALALAGEGQARERARRARQLAAILEEVRVVTEVPDEARIFFGAWVTLEDEEGEETTYRIVGPDEADVKAGRLSVESPLARALLDKEEGESVRVERPRGAIEYTVTQVSYRPPTS